MLYRTAFWVLILITVISAVSQMLGYEFLEVLIILLIIDSIAFGSIVEIEKRKSLKEIEVNDSITLKLEKLEKVCQDVLQRVNTNPALLNLEEKLKKHKEERNNMMDRISRKTLELEQKINKFGLSLAEHAEDFSNRLEKLESPEQPERKIKDLIETYMMIFNMKGEVVVDSNLFKERDAKKIVADISKIKSHTGWKPKITLEEAVLDITKYNLS